ncbi:four-carbon acid sugar kinase family protein [Prauserella flavalba]|uniref:Serine kinase n=1 Tax=Prauserella flavalba TaxID=1477506 RepID=A0A318LQA4_9PSEU|nr:four-carbon acid sugar kinase family protein [Prauserella flavalba]PXY36693.1 serine kinase [Prauserella flavalba]
MSHDIAIVADDLTGAGDTAVQFSDEGWAAELRLRPGHSSAQVVAVTTDSRACAPEQAAALVRDAVGDLLGAGVTRLFKKVDSTLRGPIRAELDAVLGALAPGTTALVCPAFPALGRTVEDGVLLVNGRPVAETSAGRDPVTPVTESHVPTLLGAPLVPLDPHGSPATWAEQVRTAGPVVVLDAADDDDLVRIARTAVELGPHALPVGSAGLAGPLARLWQPTARPTTVLVVVTSQHDTAREQVRALAEHSADWHEPAGGELTDDVAWESFAAAVLESAAARPPVLLLTAPDTAGLSAPLVSARLADVASRVLRTRDVAGLVVTGGDGARAVLDRLDGAGIRLHGHVAPGVPLGSVVGGWAAGLPISTKAGGFGAPDVLIKAAEAVRERRSMR